jgi:hypothetical protein
VRAVSVRLLGGLGNQLFGYAAAFALSRHLGTELIADTSRTRRGFTDHGIEILKIDLPGKWPGVTDRAGLTSSNALPARAISRLLWGSPILRKAFRIYSAPGVGHDDRLLRLMAGTKLNGYFQSWRIVDAANGLGLPRRLQLRVPSRVLDEYAALAHQERPIAVHVRRGDYAKIPEFGLLASTYYESGIAMLRREGFSGPVWIFTDEPERAQELVSGRIISAAPAEEMLIMSHAQAHVISNSTFGWWAAWMAGPKARVVVPDPWFRTGPEIQGLIPSDWIQSPAMWE